MNKMPITPAGFEKLSKELENLCSVVRPQVIEALQEARAHGDLSENAEYDAAKERQGMVEARINFLKTRLQQYRVVNPETLAGDRVTFGATVKIIDCNTEKTETWQIVGEDEAEIKERRISISSPLSRALIGKMVGDTVEVRTPKGVRECEIIELSFL